MSFTRRKFVQALTVAGGAGAAGSSTGLLAKPRPGKHPGRKKRTLYYNDARHYYLYVFEPPMTLEDAWRPIDEVAGTAVDTFVYGVERGDGLFYPSRVGQRFGADMRPFELTAYWRTWQNMQSLIDRGLDPLTVLIDRAHQKGMDFFASVRMASYGGLEGKYKVPEGGRGLAHEFVRDHQYAVLKELATEYATDGVELDFAAAPGGMPRCLRPEEVPAMTPVLTEWVAKISRMVRGRSGAPGQVGARIYPTEEMCLKQGLDVRTWIREGLVDYLAPMLYSDFTLDVDMPIDWVVEAAHSRDVAVYGVLAPYLRDEATGTAPAALKTLFPKPENFRGAAANYWRRGVDGLYAWFFKWPLGDGERRVLTELGDPELIGEADKHYVLHRRSKQAVEMGYQAVLPLRMPGRDAGKRTSIPFSISDDIQGQAERIRQVVLKLYVDNLVTADRLTLRLNGQSLAQEICRRDYANRIDPWLGQWLEYQLRKVRPRQGDNLLEISLDQRPAGLAGGISVESIEIHVEYGSYPTSPRV
jgi:hypothetical protein